MNYNILIGFPLAVLLFVLLVLFARFTRKRAKDYREVIKSGELWIHWKFSKNSWNWYLRRTEPELIRSGNKALSMYFQFLFPIFIGVIILAPLIEYKITFQELFSILHPIGYFAFFILLIMILSAFSIVGWNSFLARFGQKIFGGEIYISSLGIYIPGNLIYYYGDIGKGIIQSLDAQISNIEGVNCLQVTVKGAIEEVFFMVDIPIPQGHEEEAEKAARKLRLLEAINRKAII